MTAQEVADAVAYGDQMTDAQAEALMQAGRSLSEFEQVALTTWQMNFEERMTRKQENPLVYAENRAELVNGMLTASPVQKAEYYAFWRAQGLSDEDVRVGVEVNLGTQTDADWAALRALADAFQTLQAQTGARPDDAAVMQAAAPALAIIEAQSAQERAARDAAAQAAAQAAQAAALAVELAAKQAAAEYAYATVGTQDPAAREAAWTALVDANIAAGQAADRAAVAQSQATAAMLAHDAQSRAVAEQAGRGPYLETRRAEVLEQTRSAQPVLIASPAAPAAANVPPLPPSQAVTALPAEVFPDVKRRVSVVVTGSDGLIPDAATLARMTIKEKIALYRDLIDAGMLDAEIRRAIESVVGPQLDADWAALVKLAAQDDGVVPLPGPGADGGPGGVSAAGGGAAAAVVPLVAAAAAYYFLGL